MSASDTSEANVGYVYDVLSKYRFVSVDGEYCDWEFTDEIEFCIKRFRSAVLGKDKVEIRLIITSLIPEEHADKLTVHLLSNPRLEAWKEALMTAITLGSRPLVEFILPLFSEFPGEEFKAVRNSITFPSHMTPLMLACICNNFAIVECLLLRGHRIVMPHRADCGCLECISCKSSLSTKIVRLDTYKAICSDAFLWLACTDPILAACQLSKDIDAALVLEQEYKECYSRLQTTVSAFSVNIVEQCWTSAEINTLLTQKHGVTVAECDSHFPRFRLALDAHMKYFLSSLSVQLAIKELWNYGWNEYKVRNKTNIRNIMKHTVFYPIFAALHAISGGRLCNSFACPRARYFSSLTSYLVFLMILLFLRYPGRVGKDADSRLLNSSTSRFVLECYVYLYALGMLVGHYLGFIYRGIIRFYEMWWRWFDVIFFWLFFGSFYCHVMTSAAVGQDELEKLHRKHWVFYDFSLIYDIYFGGACIMAFWRIFYFVQLNRSIGLKVISVGQCVYHVVTFLWIMGVVSLCFAIGINMIYEAYSDNQAISSNGIIAMKDTFSSVLLTFRILYWAFYGYLGPKDYELIVGNAGPNQVEMHHLFTVLAGEVVVGIYHIAVILGLVNLMVSFLVRTTDEVQRNEDIEWKYTRCHIYAEHLEWYAAVPPPFNLIHILIKFLYRFLKPDEYASLFPDLTVRWEFMDFDQKKGFEEELEYESLLVKLFRRYRQWTKKKFVSSLQLDAAEILKTALDEKAVPQPIIAFMNKATIKDDSVDEVLSYTQDPPYEFSDALKMNAQKNYIFGLAEIQESKSAEVKIRHANFEPTTSN